MILCIGNRDGGDDGIGPYIADTLKIDSLDVKVLDCGTTPENYTAVVKRYKPKALVLIDAADMGLAAGDIRIIPKEKLGRMHISTHGIPLSVLITYLEYEADHIIVIGIQPKRMSGTMSSAVKKSGDHLIDILKEKKYEQIPVL
ncbi:MAG: hydrogenase 3 maturation endopeptidase HyCI [Euryarchaeota archaeon]|nr:hydrogenase 3 maturation endopeptidase HyCI [Euryarchaeota archaeon]